MHCHSTERKQNFIKFAQNNDFLNGNESPVSELTLLRYIGVLSKSCKASPVKVYLAAIRSLQIQNGFPDPFVGYLQLPLVFRGLKSLDNKPSKEKMPITSLVLHTLKLHLDLAVLDDLMIWAACCTAFFVFLRAAEFTSPSSGFIEDQHMSLSDVTREKSPVPDNAFLRLKYSKTDQFGKGCTVILARSSSLICPVAALMAYLQRWGSCPGPLFMFSNGMPLTKVKLNSRLQSLLKSCGWPNTLTLHSFRVGAATSAAALGFPDYLIQALGRWSSDAYKVYIKMPTAKLTSASVNLAIAKPL